MRAREWPFLLRAAPLVVLGVATAALCFWFAPRISTHTKPIAAQEETPATAELRAAVIRLTEQGRAALEREDHTLAAKHFREAAALAEQLPGWPRERMQCLRAAGKALRDAGRYDEAELLLQELIRAVESLPDGVGEMPPALNTLASVYEAQGRYDVAASYTHQAVVFCTTAVGDEHHVTATLKANLGWLLFRLGKLDSAERYLKEARTVYDDERIDGDLRRAALESACGRVLLARGRLREAGAALRRAAAIYAVVEPDGLAALEASTALAKCQLANDDCEAAQATLRAALAAVPPAAFEPTSVRRDALEFLARAYELAGEFAFAGELRAHAAGSAEASRP